MSTNLIERLAEHINLNGDVPTHPEPAPFFAGPGAPRPLPEMKAEPAVLRLDMPLPQATPLITPSGTPGHAAPEPLYIDLDQLAEKGFVTPVSAHSRLAEEYRIIKRPLLRTAFNNHRQGAERNHVALVTSARPGEGKTFTCVNLGMSIASEPDFQVLLVDGDVRQKGLSRLFGLGDRRGMIDAICNPSGSIADLIVKTSIPNLAILPAGQSIKAPTEILASQRAQDLFSEMVRKYTDRFIIFDSPPVLASSEPGVLAGYVGQVIFVALASETSKQAVAESLTLLDTRATINFILNRVSLPLGRSRFGYENYGAQ